MSERTRSRKAPGQARAGRGRAAGKNAGNRPGQKGSHAEKAAQRAATLRRRRAKDHPAANPEAAAGILPEAGGPEAVAAQGSGQDAAALEGEVVATESSSLSRGQEERSAVPAETDDAVRRDAPSSGDDGSAAADGNTSTGGDGNDTPSARTGNGRASKAPRRKKVKPAAHESGQEAAREPADRSDGRKARGTSRRKPAKDAASAPDQAEADARSGTSQRRTGRKARADAGSGASNKAGADASGTVRTGNGPAALETSEEPTQQAAPMPAAAAVPGAASFSDTVSPFGLAGVAAPGLGLLPSPGSVPQPRDLMIEMAEIAQIGMEANVAAARALTAAGTPSELLESQVRSMQILADAWMRQGSRLSELWMRLLPGGR